MPTESLLRSASSISNHQYFERKYPENIATYPKCIYDTRAGTKKTIRHRRIHLLALTTSGATSTLSCDRGGRKSTSPPTHDKRRSDCGKRSFLRLYINKQIFHQQRIRKSRSRATKSSDSITMVILEKSVVIWVAFPPSRSSHIRHSKELCLASRSSSSCSKIPDTVTQRCSNPQSSHSLALMLTALTFYLTCSNVLNEGVTFIGSSNVTRWQTR